MDFFISSSNYWNILLIIVSFGKPSESGIFTSTLLQKFVKLLSSDNLTCDIYHETIFCSHYILFDDNLQCSLKKITLKAYFTSSFFKLKSLFLRSFLHDVLFLNIICLKLHFFPKLGEEFTLTFPLFGTSSSPRFSYFLTIVCFCDKVLLLPVSTFLRNFVFVFYALLIFWIDFFGAYSIVTLSHGLK